MTTGATTTGPTTRFILVPGFWLGAWAWDRVAEPLRESGHDVVALTLPGLESLETDRSAITLEDHIAAVVDAVEAEHDGPIVLVAHSGSGAIVYGATDRVPDRVAATVYVDSGPRPEGGAFDPEIPPDQIEIPLPTWEDLSANGASLEGLSDEDLTRFRSRAVPQPAGPAREPLHLTNPARTNVPVTVICSSLSSEAMHQMIAAGVPMVTELGNLDGVTYVDLPTGHWPMWSRPADLAIAIQDAAAR